jgi:choline dehydrogenase-like flavoprotein
MRCESPDPAGVPAGELGDTRPRGDGIECDFAIVGSGAGGAAAAVVLAEAGYEVAVLEAGPDVSALARFPDPVTAAQETYKDGGLTFAEGQPVIPVPVGRVVGGTTLINSGTCLRPPGDLLERWRAERGIEWATALEARLDEVEAMLHVRTPALEDIGRNGRLVAEGAGRLGYSGHVLPRNAGGCTQCSACPQGCPIRAKRSMDVSYLPRAVRAGARILAGVEAGRIRFEGCRAVGLDCRIGTPRLATGGPPGSERDFVVRARRGVICAAGAFGTPELLLRSGVRHPELGKNLRLHPAIWVGARFDEPVRGWEGIMQSYKIDAFASRHVFMEATFTPLAMGTQWLPGVGKAHQQRVESFELIGSNGVHLSDSSSGRIGLTAAGRTRITYRLNKQDRNALFFGIARAAEIWFAAGATEVYPQVSGNPILFPGQEHRFEQRPPHVSQLRLEAFHPMGTARVDASDRLGVVGLDGAVRGRDGLYVADACVLPTSLGVNPMLTIIASATEIAARVADGA